MEVDHAVAKAVFLQKAHLQTDMVREGLLSASHNDGHEEQMALVDQPRSKGVGSKLRTTDEDIMLGSLFQLLNCFWSEVSLNLRLASGCSRQCLGVHDFVGCLPYLCKVLREWGISG